MRRSLEPILALLVAMSLTACGQAPADDTSNPDASGGKGDNVGHGPDGESSLCVGVRGNGQKIFGHFGALARIHEHYGLISGIAGGSSGSITSFLTESIYANEHVFFCGDEVCSDDESAARIALLYKSLVGYAGVYSQSSEVQAIKALVPAVQQLKERGIEGMLADGDTEAARALMLEVLELPDVRPLINAEVIELITNSPDPDFHVRDVWEGVSGLGAFAVESDVILVRPGIVNFDAFARLIGRVGTFYAAYGPSDADAWQAFLDGCASESVGQPWEQLAGIQTPAGATCGELYAGMLTQWRETYLADESAYPSRVDENVGAHLPVLVSTSVITGDSVEAWQQARADYTSASDYTLGVDFDDVKFGYWGREADLSKVGENRNGYGDLKTKKFLALGERPYTEPLSLSPAEPGLTRALEIRDGLVSAGGWSDLSPALVLKNMGCDRVITVTREGGTEGFDAAVARLLGMDDADNEALYVADAESAVKVSLETADGVWCTDWDNVPTNDVPGVFNDGYGAPLETTASGLLGTSNPYPNTSSELGVVGCTPGAAQ